MIYRSQLTDDGRKDHMLLTQTAFATRSDSCIYRCF